MKNCLGRIFLLLFSLPFLGAGLAVDYFAIRNALRANAVQSWESRPAKIQELELDSNYSDGSRTYRVDAQYTYEYGGQEYSSDQVAVHGKSSDNFGDWHQRVHRKLESARAENRVVAWVNPKNPSEAVLDREFRWGLMAFMLGFGGIFTLVGGSMFVAGLMALIKGDKADKNAEPELVQPPLTDSLAEKMAYLRGESPSEQVAGGPGGELEYVATLPEYTREQHVLKHSHASGLIFLALFALVWNGISFTVLFLAMDELVRKATRDPMVWLVLLFPLAGLLMIWGLGSLLARYIRYGTSTLELASLPGILGGQLSGAVTTQGNLADSRSVEVAVTCIREVTTRDSDGDRRTSQRPIWSDSYELRADGLPRAGGKTSIPVLFALPYDQPMTRGRTGDRTLWKVSVRAVRPGADYSAEWEVPVLRTATSQRGYLLEKNPLTSYLLDATPEEALKRAGIEVLHTSAGGTAWRFNRSSMRSSAGGCGVGFVILCFISAVTFTAKVPFIVPLLVGLMALGTLAGLLQILFGKSEIKVENGSLYLTGGFAGFNKTKSYPASYVSSVDIHTPTAVNSTIYSQLRFHLQDGRKVSGGGSLPSSRLIEFLKGSVETELLKQQ